MGQAIYAIDKDLKTQQ